MDTKFELTYEELNGPIFQAMQVLREKELPTQTAYTVSKIHRFLAKEMAHAKHRYIETVKECFYLDEKGGIKSFPEEPALDPSGEPLKTPNGEPLMRPEEKYRIIPEKKDLYNKAVSAFLQEKVTIPWRKVQYAELRDVKLDAETLELLEPVISGLPKSPETSL